MHFPNHREHRPEKREWSTLHAGGEMEEELDDDGRWKRIDNIIVVPQISQRASRFLQNHLEM